MSKPRRRTQSALQPTEHACERYQERFEDIPKERARRKLESYGRNARRVRHQRDGTILYTNGPIDMVAKDGSILTVRPAHWRTRPQAHTNTSAHFNEHSIAAQDAEVLSNAIATTWPVPNAQPSPGRNGYARRMRNHTRAPSRAPARAPGRIGRNLHLPREVAR